MNKALVAAAAIMIGVTPAVAQDLSETFSSYIAFGDSLTDDGKFMMQAPPSLEGRFSNGRTYAEIISDDFAVSSNFAIGGATARDINENPLPLIGTFSGQVTAFSAGIVDPMARAALGDRPLFSVLFGGNDVLQNVGLPDPDAPGVPGNVNIGAGAEAAIAVADNIRAINALDEEFNDFVVLNLPDVSQTPLFNNPAFGAGDAQLGAFLASAGYNQELSDQIDLLRGDGINIIEFDLNAFNQELLANAMLEGIDIQTPCTFSLSIDNGDSCADIGGGEVDLSLADDFFFVDGVHPNRVAQAAVAEEFRAVVAAAVPLPAGLPLLLAGIGVFGFFRMRRSA